ncbi:MAG: hypothetical protein ACI89X_003860 [Planctomycetota bacterium]
MSLPYRVRLLCAHDPAALSAVRRILVHAVSGYYERTAKRFGKPLPRTGAVAFVQRFDSALRLNVHLHVLWLDGVYSHEPGRGGVEWCQHEQVTDADVAQLVRRVRDRVRRKLRKMGKWLEDNDALAGDAMCDPSDAEQLLLELGEGAVQGVAVTAKRRGQRDVRIGKGTRNEPNVLGALCADLEGFSLHAAVRVAAGNRRQFEHLCRYAGRPAIAESRLRQLVAYSEELHKVDSASRQRPCVPHRPAKRRVHGRRYYTWAELLRRVYAIDILTCPRCGGVRRLLAAI